MDFRWILIRYQHRRNYFIKERQYWKNKYQRQNVAEQDYRYCTGIRQRQKQKTNKRESARAYHCCGGIAEFHHHKGFLWHDCRQRNPHINRHGPLSIQWPKKQLSHTMFLQEENGNYHIPKQSLSHWQSITDWRKTIKFAYLSNVTFEQKKQLPQGMIKAPTTWDPIGNLKHWEDETYNPCCLVKKLNAMLYIIVVNRRLSSSAHTSL